MAQLVQNPPEMWETWVQSLGWKDPLEKGMVTHSSILAWRILRTVQSMRSQRVGHNSATFISLGNQYQLLGATQLLVLLQRTFIFLNYLITK